MFRRLRLVTIDLCSDRHLLKVWLETITKNAQYVILGNVTDEAVIAL
jgi:hypothetical protein